MATEIVIHVNCNHAVNFDASDKETLEKQVLAWIAQIYPKADVVLDDLMDLKYVEIWI